MTDQDGNPELRAHLDDHDGTNDIITIPSSSSMIAQTNALTIASWVKVPTNPSNNWATLVEDFINLTIIHRFEHTSLDHSF